LERAAVAREADKVEEAVAAIARIDAVPRILDVVCRTTGMGFAAVARVTDDRWIACAVHDEIQFGLQPGGELQVATTICHEIRQSGSAVVIDHVAEDDTFRQHPTPAMYGFQSYISVPIVRPSGGFFGTLCAIDPRPMMLNTPETLGMFQLFAELIAAHLDAHERLASSEAALLGEREGAELREQFIAVLGHDLRNPLASIDAGTKMLLRTPLDDKGKTIVGLMQNSATRMAKMIDNVLDLARGRLGTGISLARDANQPLVPVLNQVAAELQASWPDREIETDFSLAERVNCDRTRIAQLFSNLLGNAITHGAADRAIRARAGTDGAHFELWVSNAGDPIPAAALDRLFRPFTRGAIRPNQQGLGLGLYIASEIARAHGGTLHVSSTAEETRFTFRMPLR
jgi:signal transduction histidine kinase